MDSQQQTHRQAGQAREKEKGPYAYSGWGSSRGLRGRVGHSVVHEVGPRAAADDLTPSQAHAHPSIAPSSIVGHAMRSHHSGYLRRAALRVKVAPSAVLAVQLGL